MPRPKGHKRGCHCVVCKNMRRTTTRKAIENHGYEDQATALRNLRHRELAAEGKRAPSAPRAARRNSTVPIGGTARMGSLQNRVARRPNPSHEIEEMFFEHVDYWHRSTTKSARHRAALLVVAALKAYPELKGKLAPEELRDVRADAKKRNPAHYPRTPRGPKGNPRWYILDLFDGRGNRVSSRYRKCARAKCATEAMGLVNRRVGKHMVRKVELSGPYARKPGASTARK